MCQTKLFFLLGFGVLLGTSCKLVQSESGSIIKVWSGHVTDPSR
jgi:hypothetical protein